MADRNILHYASEIGSQTGIALIASMYIVHITIHTHNMHAHTHARTHERTHPSLVNPQCKSVKCSRYITLSACERANIIYKTNSIYIIIYWS